MTVYGLSRWCPLLIKQIPPTICNHPIHIICENKGWRKNTDIEDEVRVRECQWKSLTQELSGYLFSPGFVLLLPLLQFPWLASSHAPKMLLNWALQQTLSVLLSCRCAPLPPIYNCSDWVLLFFALDYSPFPRCRLVSSNSALPTGPPRFLPENSHTSCRIPC